MAKQKVAAKKKVAKASKKVPKKTGPRKPGKTARPGPSKKRRPLALVVNAKDPTPVEAEIIRGDAGDVPEGAVPREFALAFIKTCHAQEDAAFNSLLDMAGSSGEDGVFGRQMVVQTVIHQEERLVAIDGDDEEITTMERERYASIRKQAEEKVGSNFSALYAQQRKAADDGLASVGRPPLPKFNPDGTIAPG